MPRFYTGSLLSNSSEEATLPMTGQVAVVRDLLADNQAVASDLDRALDNGEAGQVFDSTSRRRNSLNPLLDALRNPD